MRPLLTSLLALLSALALPARESVREIIHPRADLPAFHCLVPGNWRSEVDATGNLQLSNPDRTAVFSLSFAHTPNPADAFDALARAVLGGANNPPWASREPVEISGHRGFRYAAQLKPGGTPVRVEILLVAAGDHHIASCSMVLSERVRADDETTARLVQAGIKLLVAP